MSVKPENLSKELQLELNKELDILIDDIFVESQENIVRLNKVDTGWLLQSGKVYKNFLEKTIVYDAPHAGVIEFGADPHPVSREGRANIAKWARRKLGLSEKEAIRASYAIAAKIRTTKTEPSPYLRPAANKFAEGVTYV